jgi:hypothetical protein
MAKTLMSAGAVVGLFFASVAWGTTAEDAPGLDLLQGKWTVAKTNREGRAYTHVLEIKTDRFVLQVRNPENELRLFAKGVVKAGKIGPFQVLRFTGIEAGRSPDDLQPVDDERSVVYAQRNERLFVAANFDRERENERPSADAYVRMETREVSGSAPASGEAKVLGTWKMDVTIGDNTSDYELKISRAGGNLKAVLVSPRSGEHPCKSAQFKDGELVVEVEREYGGNAVVVVYKAKLAGEELKGTVSARGFEEQFSGQITATK